MKTKKMVRVKKAVTRSGVKRKKVKSAAQVADECVAQYLGTPDTAEDYLRNDLLASLRSRDIAHGPDDNISHFLAEAATEGHSIASIQKLMVDAITPHFEAIIELLLINKNDPNVIDTPRRLASMYVTELFEGRYSTRPKVTDFPKLATGATDNMLCIGPIEVKSVCSHHWAPIIGHCWIAVLPEDRLLGLSKYARLIHWVTARPSLQENMAEHIANEIGQSLNTPHVAVIIDAVHQCMSLRGAEEPHAITATHVMRGAFRDNGELRQEFLMYVARCPAP